MRVSYVILVVSNPKVRFFTKSAQYRIKICVVIDAETASFLKVIIYTGKYNYTKNYNT